MGLHWNFDEKLHPRVKEDERVYREVEEPNGAHSEEGGKFYRLTGMAETLVLLTMPCGLGQITDKNVEEFYVRVKLLEAMQGGGFFHDGKGKEIFIQPEHVHAMIGLRTNVSNETRASFKKRIVEQRMNDWGRDWRRAKSKLDEERAETLAAQLELV